MKIIISVIFLLSSAFAFSKEQISIETLEGNFSSCAYGTFVRTDTSSDSFGPGDVYVFTIDLGNKLYRSSNKWFTQKITKSKISGSMKHYKNYPGSLPCDDFSYPNEPLPLEIYKLISGKLEVEKEKPECFSFLRTCKASLKLMNAQFESENNILNVKEIFIPFTTLGSFGG